MASFDASKDEIQAVERATKELESAMARARGIRLCLGLAAVLLIALICFKFYGLGMDLQSPEYQNALLSTGQKRLAAKSDQYSKHLDLLIDKTQEPLFKAFKEQINKDAPVFMKEMEKEKDKLTANLEEKFTERINTYYEGLAKQEQEALEKEFPSIKDPATRDRMVKNVDKAVQGLIKKYYVEDLRKQIQEMQDTWNTFPAAATPKAGEPKLMDQFITTLLQYLAIKLSQSGLVTKA